MENVSVAACRRSSANNRMNADSTRNAQNGNVRSLNSDALIELSPAARQQAQELVSAELLAHLAALNSHLEPHQRISHFVLVREPWTVDNGCMTPTMKIRRNVLEARYAGLVERLPAHQPLLWE